MARRKYVRTPAQRQRMSEAQIARHAKTAATKLNGSTVGLADAVTAVGLAKRLVNLGGRDAARQFVDLS